MTYCHQLLKTVATTVAFAGILRTMSQQNARFQQAIITDFMARNYNFKQFLSETKRGLTRRELGLRGTG